MQTYLPKILLVLLLNLPASIAVDGQISAPVIELNSNRSGSTWNFAARDEIKMRPGFVFSSSSNNSLTARIDAGLLFPPTEATYKDTEGNLSNDPTRGAVVGSIPGEFAVSPTGAATYTIPIEVPAGINGMQPSVSLVYNSQAGNGIAGWGWNLSGMSSITRIGKTMYHDDDILPVQLTGADNLMLDGQRLIHVSGTNLTSDARYRTESEVYSDVRHKFINGYLCFEVKTKAGLIMEYGSSPDSYIEAQGSSTPMTWLLRKVSDSDGNYMVYNYGENNANGEFWLDNIQYTGNAGAGVSPVNRIEFVYQTNRFDSQTNYVAGKKISQTQLLETILIKTNTYVHKRYEISHIADSLYHKIERISLSSGGNTKYNDTEVIWGTPVSSYHKQYKTLGNFNNSTSHAFYYYDFNADGRTDFITLKPNATSVDIYLADNLNGFTKHSTYSSYQNKKIKHVLTGDFNGDGYGDFAYYREGTPPLVSGRYEYDVVLFDGAVFTFNSRMGGGGSEDRALVGNFTGDGKDKLLHEYNSTLTGIGNFWSATGVIWGTELYSWFPNNKYQLDFNGDGKTDVFVMDAGGYRIYGHNGLIFTLINSGSYPTNTTGVYFGDFNGDGKTDLLTQKTSYGGDHNETAIHFATGDGFTTKIIPWMRTWQTKLFIGDFNNDGRSDFSCFGISPYSAYCSFWVGLSTGDDFLVKKYDTNYSYSYATGDYINRLYNSDFDGDGRDEMLMNHYMNAGGTGLDISYFDSGDESLCVKKITDGSGVQNRIDYTTMSNSTVYTNTASYPFPVSLLKENLKVVSSYEQGNDAILFRINQRYENARLHKQGKGFLGFEKVKTTDVTKGIIYENTMGYHPTFYNIYPVEQTVKTTSGAILSTTLLTNQVIPLSGKRIFPYLSTQTSTDYLTGLSETKTISRFDSYGNPQLIQTTKGSRIEKDSIVYIQKGSWCPNKPRYYQKTVTYDGRSDTIEGSYEYNNKGTLIKEILHPNSADYRVTTEYKDFNSFGQAQTIEVKAKDAGGIERIRRSSLTYTPSGRFVATRTNVLNETTSYAWDELRGLLDSETSRGQTTYYTYDSFGRLQETRYPDATRQTEVLQWAGGGGPTGAVYYRYTQTSGNAPLITWFDALGREVRQDTYGLYNRHTRKIISVSTEYYTSGPDKGRLFRVSEPYFEGDVPVWATTYNVYNNYGRPTTITTPLGPATYSYNGLSTTVTTPSETKTTTLNPSGFVASSTVNGKTVSYTYYPSGMTKTASPQGGQILSMEYNLQGKRTRLTDPDAGIIETKYNGFGELVEEKQKVHSDNLIVTSYHFEPTTGRLKSIDRNGEITSYDYDIQNRIGSIELAGRHKQEFTYDQHDRVTNIREEINGMAFNRSKEYDALGRIKKDIYPSGYYTVNVYDKDYGFPTDVRDKDGRVLWQIVRENARGQLTEVQRGGKITKFGFDNKGMPTDIKASGIVNLSYDFGNDGNLNNRIDSIMGQEEEFVYDGMNRLTHWNIYQNNVLVKPNSMVYNATTGTISTKSDLDNFTMNYGENGKPHALTSIEGMPTDFPTAGLNVTYTDFKKIKTLTEGNTHYVLTYGVDDQRRKSEYKINGVTQKTKYYLGDYEEERDNLGNTKKIHYLSGGAILVNTNGVATLYYGYTDYQGNLMALANESGTVVERYAYDPWGKQRNPANGRVYDPLTAQFFSPDPFVQAPGNWLNYNRYSYCFNNPLKYTDLTGEFIFTALLPGAGVFIDAALWGAVIGGAGYTANVAFSDGGFNNWNWGQFGKSVGFGAASGVLTAGIGQAFGAVGSNGIIGEVGRAVSHGVANGMMTGIQGGDFMTGFAAGGLSSLAGSAFMMYGGKFANSNLGIYTFSALAGGVGAELTGGNFWQGAATGLMTAGLNHAQQGLNKLIYNKTFNRIGYVPLDEEVGYQMANYKMRLRIWQNGDDQLSMMAETFNTPVDGDVVASADARLMVNNKQVAAQALSLKRNYIYPTGGLNPIGEAYFQMPTSGNVSINFRGGWTVYMPGGAAVPIYHPIGYPVSININQRIVIR